MLRNCGVIDPDRIDEYIARDGYKALEKVLFEMTPQDVVDEITKSGLRGRGGAGFPTGVIGRELYGAAGHVPNGTRGIVDQDGVHDEQASFGKVDD